ncbi:HNH endonuclease [Mycolicibacterium palauense]|uniref:HNH endonuclease n=1 Tax=Mycolicibacterium palauense TaxID=2034511 RepID=UPI000BFEFC7F
MPTHSKNGPRPRGRAGVRFQQAKNRVLRTNQICAFRGNGKYPACGQLIDLSLKYPDPMSPTVNHIIPVKDLAWDDPLQYSVENLEPMHLVCNQRLGAGSQKKAAHVTSRRWRD